MRSFTTILVLMLAFVSCRHEPTPSESLPADTVNREARIRVCLQNHNFNSFIPPEVHFYNEAQAMNLVFDTLVQADHAGHLSPCLASSWEISPNGKEYTFHLRRNVRFHNGKRLTSDDVIFTLQELIRKKANRKGDFCGIIGSREFIRHSRQSVSGLVRVDDNNFKILLTRRFNLFLHFLTSKAASIVPANFAGVSREEFRTKPIGTGPFISSAPPFSKTVKHQPFIQLNFHRNKQYFQQSPALSQVELYLPLTPPRANTLYYFDIFLPPEEFSIQTVPQATHRAITTAHDTNVFLAINPSIRPGLSESWRSIIQNGLDRHELVKKLGIEKNAVPAYSILPVTLFGHNRYYRLDPALVDQARSLLGEDARKTINVVIYPRQLSLVNVLNDQLNPLGITLNPRVLDNTRYYSGMWNRKREAMIIRGVPDFPHAFNFLTQLYKPNGLLNYFSHNNPAIMEAIDKLPVSDIREQAVLFQQLADLCTRDAYYIPLYFLSDNLILRRNVSPLRFKFGGIIDFHSIEVYHESIDGNH